METSAWIAAVLAVAVLVLVIGSVAVKGLSSISLNFLTQNADPNSIEATGGIANALVGTGIMVGLATLMAVPVGILIGHLHERVRWFEERVHDPVLPRRPERRPNDRHRHLHLRPHRHGSGPSERLGWGDRAGDRDAAAGCPLVPGGARPRSRLGQGGRPGARREPVADDDLGRRPYGPERDDHRRAACGCARAGRDGAAAVRELDLRDQPCPPIPRRRFPACHVVIFQFSESPTPAKHDQAWAAALVLIVVVLLISIVARALSARIEASTGGGTLIMENGSKGSASHELSTE